MATWDGPGSPSIQERHRSAGCGCDAAGGHGFGLIWPTWEKSQTRYSVVLGDRMYDVSNECDDPQLIGDPEGERLAYRCEDDAVWQPIYVRPDKLVRVDESIWAGAAEDADDVRWSTFPSWDEVVEATVVPTNDEERWRFMSVVGALMFERDPRGEALLLAAAKRADSTLSAHYWCSLAGREGRTRSEDDLAREARLQSDLLSHVQTQGIESLSSITGCRHHNAVAVALAESNPEQGMDMLLLSATHDGDTSFCSRADELATTPELRARFVDGMVAHLGGDFSPTDRLALDRRVRACDVIHTHIAEVVQTDQAAAMTYLLTVLASGAPRRWCSALEDVEWEEEPANAFVTELSQQLSAAESFSTQTEQQYRCRATPLLLRASTLPDQVERYLAGMKKLRHAGPWWCELVQEQSEGARTRLMEGMEPCEEPSRPAGGEESATVEEEELEGPAELAEPEPEDPATPSE